MATTEILAAGTSAATSTEFAIAAGSSVTLTMKPAAGYRTIPPKAVIVIEMKRAAGGWVEHDILNAQQSAVVLSAVGDFRCRRAAQAVAVGVDSAS